jgi:hypothetical protein
VPDFKFSIKIKQRSENRKSHNKNYPGEFCGRVASCVKDIYRNEKAEQKSAEEKFRHKRLEPEKHRKKEKRLKRKKHDYYSETAENRVDYSFLAFFQKPKAGIFKTFSFGRQKIFLLSFFSKQYITLK